MRNTINQDEAEQIKTNNKLRKQYIKKKNQLVLFSLIIFKCKTCELAELRATERTFKHRWTENLAHYFNNNFS